MPKSPTIQGLLYRTGQARPEPVTLENSLETFQKLVDGPIDVLNLTQWDSVDADIIINDEGKLRELPPNRPLPTLTDHEGKPWQDFIAGDFVVVGTDHATGDFKSLPKETAEQVVTLFNRLGYYRSQSA